MSGRTPEEVLAVFGRDLRRYRAPRRRWRWIAGLVAVVLAAGAATAAATGSIWAPSPRVSATALPYGAPKPDAASRPVYVATGRDWRLSASSCRFGARATVALFLTVPGGGGAGWRCEALSRRVANGVAPPPTLYTPPHTRPLLFGAAPSATTSVQALLLDTRSGKTRLREIATRQSQGFTAYVARLTGDVRLLTVVGLDAHGRPTMRCDQEMCR